MKTSKIHELWPLLWYCLLLENAIMVVEALFVVGFVLAGCITAYHHQHVSVVLRRIQPLFNGSEEDHNRRWTSN